MIRLHPVRHYLKKELKYLKKSNRKSLGQILMFLKWLKRRKMERQMLLKAAALLNLIKHQKVTKKKVAKEV